MNIVNKSVINSLKENTTKLLNTYIEFGLVKSPKQISEDISGLLETAIERNIEGAIAPKVDSEPDIRYNGKPIEIKTSAGTSWRGGTFSKRPGYYIFVTYTIDANNVPSFYIAGINLKEEDWKSSTSDSYYATTYGKKEIYLNKDKVTTYAGSLVGKEGKRLIIKVNYE
jgi:hypothetical protein|tara:strand:- start:101 stop:607 length:507 start_codon:yes stop_codon:yes gene_type:complete